MGPRYIDSYPSAIATLATLLRDARLPAPRPKAIITSSETLLGSQRLLVEDVFSTRCFDQYGCTEQAMYVSQCEHGTYHIHPEYGIVEVLRPDGVPASSGEIGEVICTTFSNDALPLFRYRTGDAAVVGGRSCPCARAFPSLLEIVGRMDDMIVTPDGRKIGRLDPVFKGRQSVFEAQIVQQSSNRVLVRLVPTEGYTDEDGAAIVHELRARLGPTMDVALVRVPMIERTASGKFKSVVNEYRSRSTS